MAPGIVTEAVMAGRWLFQWRSYLPLAILAYVLVDAVVRPIPEGGVHAIPAWSVAGILVGLTGFLFRAWTVGHVPMGTSGRGTAEPVAAMLNTRGTYSIVRHPLYFGNFLLWMGTTMVAGNVAALLVVALAFWVYYERIMIAEERFLHERFGDAFREWSARTPAFWPRLTAWIPSAMPFSARYALGRDYQALYGLVAATTAVEIGRRLALGEPWAPSPPWRVWFAAGTGFYVVVHLLKRRTRLLERPDV